MPFLIRQGDTQPVLQAVLRLNGEPYDLSDAASVTFRYRLASATSVTSRTCTVVNPTAGVVEYAWQTGDLISAGAYVGEWRVTTGDGGRLTFPNDGLYPFTVSSAL